MPKAFDEREKQIIRARLKDKGKNLFEKQGLKKTSVDELARAAGISKGAFYIFFPSKEILLMEILEEIETDIHSRILNETLGANKDSTNNVARILESMVVALDEYPLLKNFGREDYEYLLRKIPLDQARAHAERDGAFAKNFLKKLKSENIKFNIKPRMVGNLIKSLFFFGLHRDEMGDTEYRETAGVLIKLIARYIAEGR